MLNSILKTKKCRTALWLIQWTKHMLSVLFYEMHIWSIKSFKRATFRLLGLYCRPWFSPQLAPGSYCSLRLTKLLSGYGRNVFLIYPCPLSNTSLGWKLCAVVVTHFVPKIWFILKYFQVAALMFFRLCWGFLIRDSR